MTETEWLNGTAPQPMLEFLQGKVSQRKFRLFAVAAYRHIWHRVTDPSSRVAVEVADRFADGLADLGERTAAFSAAHTSYINSYDDTIFAYAAADEDAAHAAHIAARDVESVQGVSGLAPLLREVVGNPFRRAVLDPSWCAWNEGTIVKIARSIYERRAFDRMPLLAEALEEAGCEDQALLAHCLRSGRHVRGCWAVDGILGHF